MTVPPKPSRGPDPASMRDVEEFQRLAEESVQQVRGSAERWRTGMAALVTVVTTALLVKGPEKAAEIAVPWRVALTVCLSVGLLLAVAALWRVLLAAAGDPSPMSLARIRADHGGVAAFRVAQAARAAVQLRQARRMLLPALVLLVAGMVVWWWAPPRPVRPQLSVEHRPPGAERTETTCGKLSSADGQTLVLVPAGAARSVTIPFAEVENLKVLPTCP